MYCRNFVGLLSRHKEPLKACGFVLEDSATFLLRREIPSIIPPSISKKERDTREQWLIISILFVNTFRNVMSFKSGIAAERVPERDCGHGCGSVLETIWPNLFGGGVLDIQTLSSLSDITWEDILGTFDASLFPWALQGRNVIFLYDAGTATILREI